MASIWTDENKFRKMLAVEIFACEAFTEEGLIPRSALAVIKNKANIDVKRIQEIEEKTNHDVMAFIKNVSEYVGEEAKYFHFGLTSSDILDTALSVMMAEAMDILISGAEKLKESLRKKAIKYKMTPMMGRSHGVHAEPITFGLKMALFYKEIERDIKRLKVAREVIAYGKISGSVGTFANVSPFVEEYVCGKLGLKPAGVSTQVLQRDRHAEYLTAIAITGATLEKLAVEIRGLQRTETGEVQEFFASGQTGSSSMPHKRNPIICERITGLSRILRANAMAAIENVALWHERDISHSSVERVIIPDSAILLDYMLDKIVVLVDKLIVNEEKMRENINITKGLIYSQKVLLELIKKGATRLESYDIVQTASLKAADSGKELLAELLLSDKMKKYMTKEEIEACFKLEYHLRYINEIFKRAGIE
ncbi:adenylosuccinate lyase [Candidatus Omnitrophus magneticus]|uniref:Adenylosuccinate lyase n=1 Tax=Candidatus Omnitrophus magneticus TaxID=1609969 RepID=A0A0F0CKJ5_9BACT|nr:adenylosuccinate lyase [Candidatus Omnitrophus magneticus]